MYERVEKQKENKSQAVTNYVAQKKSDGKLAIGFVDNRPKVIAQRKMRALANDSISQPIQKKENSTGLPDNLKAGMENLSGHSMDDVKVHYNSSKPAQLNAHAYAQGTDIHLSAGQEKHLPHEAWHLVQQKQGRVKPTLQLKDGVNLNADPGLEKDADVMGENALTTQHRINKPLNSQQNAQLQQSALVQRTKKTAAIAGATAGGMAGSVLGGLTGAALVNYGLITTGLLGFGALSTAVVAGMGLGLIGGALVGAYKGTTKSEVNPPYRPPGSVTSKKSYPLELYYSEDQGRIVLGHYTILLKLPKEIIRFHFVMGHDAHPIRRKLKQISGTGKGVPLEENIIHKTEKDGTPTVDKYGDSARPLEKTWMIDQDHVGNLIKFIQSLSAKNTSYGYFIYANSVDNCGSMAMKALAEAGISIKLFNGDQLHQFPSMIRDDVKQGK